MAFDSAVSNDETVARILHQDWVVDGVIQLGAFTLRPHETYISVNRPSVSSFASDVANFVRSHPMFQHTASSYRFAILSVEDIRNIKLTNNGAPVNIDVEVEPRSAHIASHAGIFTRVESTNIKKGSTLPAEALPLGLSADDILMEVEWSLMAVSMLQEKQFQDE